MTSGSALKEEGMAQALAAARLEYQLDFYAAVTVLALSGRCFTSEDVIDVIGLPRGRVSTNRNNAVGALMNGAARRGLITKTGRRVLSTRPTSHAAELAEWQAGDLLSPREENT